VGNLKKKEQDREIVGPGKSEGTEVK